MSNSLVLINLMHETNLVLNMLAITGPCSIDTTCDFVIVL